MPLRQITALHYEHLLRTQIFSIIHLNKVNGENIEKGFAICKPFGRTQNGLLFPVVFKKDGAYYSSPACIKTAKGHFVNAVYTYAYTNNNEAITIGKKSHKSAHTDYLKTISKP
jgi:hypothetical protein